MQSWKSSEDSNLSSRNDAFRQNSVGPSDLDFGGVAPGMASPTQRASISQPGPILTVGFEQRSSFAPVPMDASQSPESSFGAPAAAPAIAVSAAAAGGAAAAPPSNFPHFYLQCTTHSTNLQFGQAYLRFGRKYGSFGCQRRGRRILLCPRPSFPSRKSRCRGFVARSATTCSSAISSRTNTETCSSL